MGGVNVPSRDEYEDYLRSSIAAIRKSADEAMKPYIDALVRLHAYDPPRPFFITKEQADSIALHLSRRG